MLKVNKHLPYGNRLKKIVIVECGNTTKNGITIKLNGTHGKINNAFEKYAYYKIESKLATYCQNIANHTTTELNGILFQKKYL